MPPRRAKKRPATASDHTTEQPTTKSKRQHDGINDSTATTVDLPSTRTEVRKRRGRKLSVPFEVTGDEEPDAVVAAAASGAASKSLINFCGFGSEPADAPVYFDKLPPRQPFDDINTSRMDNVFRASCFKNAVCTITTNLKININHFTNLIGGQLTSTLPGNRLVLVINGQRYSVICYNTGRFVLTNLFFFNRLKDIYDFFINFCLLLIKRGIATLTAVDNSREGPERRFRILFLVENCQFSFRFKDEVCFFAIHENNN